jgi:hypothetical protein
MTEFETSVQRAAANNLCLLIGGDFNLPGWNWTNKTLHSGTQHAHQYYYFSNILDDHGLTQLVQEPTRNKNTLDLLITNYPSKILRIDITRGISDHDIIYAEMNMNSAINTQKPRKILIYRKAKWDSMKEDVSNLHRKIQQESTNGTDINNLWNIFKGGLEASVNKHIPHKVCKRKDKLPWITQELKSLIRKRDRAYKTKKKSNHPQDTKKCKHLKQTIQRKSRQAYWKRNCDTREQRRSTLSSKKILDIHKT